MHRTHLGLPLEKRARPSLEPRAEGTCSARASTTPVIVRHMGKATTRYNGSQSKGVSQLSFKDVVKIIIQLDSEINNDQPR